MKIEKKDLDLKNGLNLEWVITNGLGAICSSSVIGANTRRYHGLLVAPLLPPARRYLLISKVDESIRIGDKDYNLYTNVCKDYVSDGFKYLESFEKEYIPIYTYNVDGVKIIKKIVLEHERNTVVVNYSVENKGNSACLTLTPIVNFRDFHALTTDHDFHLKQQSHQGKVRLEVDGNSSSPIYLYVKDSNYIEHNDDTFKNMYYMKEDERGFYPEENLAVSGRFQIYIKPNEIKEITFVGSLEENIEEIDGAKIIENEISRLDKIIRNANLKIEKNKLLKKDKDYNKFLDELVIATDNFVIYRPSFGYHSILAGIPWFLDWGRDALIAFEGITLLTKRFDIAKDILLTFTRDIKFGLVPNGYSGFDNRPLYNSVDSSLLLFEQVNKYLKYTNDFDFIKDNIYPKLISIIEHYEKGIDVDNNNIYIDSDGLLSSGTETTQNTWMDVKIDNLAVTPRNGKVVEINSLWYNALKTLENLARKFKDKDIEKTCKQKARRHQKVFNQEFYNGKKKSLFDVLGDDKIRPNQLFSFSLTYPVFDLQSDRAFKILDTVEDKLLTKYGLKTLAKGESGYISVYEGDSTKRDMSYHQGVPWVWLLGLYFDSLRNMINAQKSKKLKKKLQAKMDKLVESTYNIFKREIEGRECIGNISELYSGTTSHKPAGAPAQAWSVSEVLRIVNEYRNLI